ncbi:RNA-binding protein 34 [Pelodytes ibericus]
MAKKANKLKKSKCLDETPKDDLKVPEEYVAGEIAGSLFSKKSSESSTGLISLFDSKTCTVQPVYVPAAIAAPKRKLPEVQVPAKEDSRVVNQEPPKKRKPLSEAEKKVADRELALTNADEEEKTQPKPKHKTKDTEVDAVTKRLKRKLHKKEEAAKNSRTVFVGNLPVDCTKQALKGIFKEFGPIESVRFRSLAPAEAKLSRKAATIQRKAHPKRKNINAYVVFKEENSATCAVKKNGTEVASGVHIRVDLASKSTCHDNKRSIFIGNLPYDAQDDAVRDHFSECGNVEAVRLIRDKSTGIGKGFGYVLFESTDAVQLGLKLNNTELMGRKLRVKRCLGESSAKPAPKNVKPKFENVKQTKSPKSNAFAGETAEVKKMKKKIKKKKNKKKKSNK